MIDSWSNYSNRQSTHQEHLLYAHLLERVEVEPPREMIKRFRDLFVDGIEYSAPQVRQALEKIVLSNIAEREFKFILNRCCYILINRWLSQPRLQSAIPELIALFATASTRFARSRTTQRLRELVQQFTQTEQYLALRRLAEVSAQKTEDGANAESKPLGTLIRRYPCLYEYCLLTNDSTDEQRQQVRSIQAHVQQRFEIDLSQYITYQQLERSPVKNPTLLSDRQLNDALTQFAGKVDGTNTYRDLAEHFRTYSRRTRCYRTFKDELYEYLTASIDPEYGKYQFNQLLHKQLQSTLPQNNAQEFNEALLLRTCRKLLDFLVVESPQRPDHYIFSDLTSNLGITSTIGLLLKIVLLCRQVKPYLEKQFSILFNHYEACTKDSVMWLIESLENLNVAFSTHFGQMKLVY